MESHALGGLRAAFAMLVCHLLLRLFNFAHSLRRTTRLLPQIIVNMRLPHGLHCGILIGLLLFIGSHFNVLNAQNTLLVKGRVYDNSTILPVPFATIGVPGANVGARTDQNGDFKIRINPKKNRELRFTCVGYAPFDLKIPKDSTTSLTVDVFLEPKTQQLSEIEIRPDKYSNKNNPAVELIELVVKNRDRNRPENFKTYRVDQYEKIMMGVSNLGEKTKNRRFLRDARVVFDNVDTTKMEGLGISPIYMSESILDYYSRNDPKQNKSFVTATQFVQFPLMEQEGIDQWSHYLYQDIDLYDNYVVILTDHFLSPIANNAPLFYRYYPEDTIIENGSKIVKLLFFPRNKTDMLLKGELYIALDSTYPVTKAVFGVSEQVNLNFVKDMVLEQRFQKTTDGKWVLGAENYRMDFGVTTRGMGLFGERYVHHSNPRINTPIPDSIFDNKYEKKVVREDAAAKRDTTFWNNARPVELSAVEKRTYSALDSLQRTKLFKRMTKAIFILAVGHWKPIEELEIGRINTFYSFNSVEGDRIKFGGRTRPELSKRFNLEGFGAYGLKDERWKFGVAANISMDKRKPYNSFPLNVLRINYQHDLRQPGVELTVFQNTNLATSFVRGVNDRFFFMKRFSMQYDREFPNQLAIVAGFEHRWLQPLGSLSFIPTDDILPLNAPVIAAKPYIQFRYAPGEQYYQTSSGWRQRIRFNYILQARYARGISGLAGSQYDFDEVTASFYKFSNVPPIGYNYFYVEAGGVFGKVPYPFLTIHRANQSYNYKYMAYNMMNFMEFVSDRYVAVNIEHAFYGFFTNKIPLIKRLKLRETCTLKVLYGQVSDRNQPRPGAGLYEFPRYPDGTPLTFTLQDKPYIEASVGLGNIFKVLRFDLIRRFTYLDNPGVNKFGLRVTAQVQF
jgi:Family of unknown function (DUF5686)/CarboxypepD_reg-like domain